MTTFSNFYICYTILGSSEVSNINFFKAKFAFLLLNINQMVLYKNVTTNYKSKYEQGCF